MNKVETMNKVVFVGKLVAKPMIHQTSSGIPVINFCLEQLRGKSLIPHRIRCVAFGEDIASRIDSSDVGDCLYVSGPLIESAAKTYADKHRPKSAYLGTLVEIRVKKFSVIR